MLAKDVMSRNPVFVSPDTNLRKAIRLMAHKGVSGLPVIDDDGKLCGMLTEGDILQHSKLNFAPPSLDLPHDDEFFRRYIKSHGATVADCMTSPVVSVAPTTNLLHVVAKMREHGIKRVPVVDDERLVGIVSRHDVLLTVAGGPDMIAHGDDALRLAIETRLKVELGLTLGKADLKVRDAVVELVGSFNSDAQRQAIRLLVQGISGVAGIKFIDDV